MIGRGDEEMEISYLFFVDETFLFCYLKKQFLLHLKCILLCFQDVSGLNINLDKTELVKLGDKGDECGLAKVLGCKATNLPINILGCLLVLGTRRRNFGNR